MAIAESFYYHTANSDSVCHRVAVNKQSIEDFITGSDFVIDFTSKSMPEFLPEILCYSVNINFIVISSIITLYYPADLCKIIRRDYERMNSELKRQGRKLYIKISFKQKIHLWLLTHFPNLYKRYLKTRLAIKRLTGI